MKPLKEKVWFCPKGCQLPRRPRGGEMLHPCGAAVDATPETCKYRQRRFLCHFCDTLQDVTPNKMGFALACGTAFDRDYGDYVRACLGSKPLESYYASESEDQ